MTTLEADPRALRAAAAATAHDGWAIRLATDVLARTLASAQPRLGAATTACTGGVEPIITSAYRLADSVARLAEALGTLAEGYRHVDGQHRTAARWC